MIEVKATQMQAVRLGRQGENERTLVIFDVADIVSEYPSAEFTLLNRTPGASIAYPCEAIDRIGGVLSWEITGAELVNQGRGQCQIVATVDGIVAKTCIFSTEILPALDGSGDPPEPWDNWQTAFTALRDKAQAAAEDARQAADDAEQTVEKVGFTAEQVGGDNYELIFGIGG